MQIDKMRGLEASQLFDGDMRLVKDLMEYDILIKCQNKLNVCFLFPIKRILLKDR